LQEILKHGFYYLKGVMISTLGLKYFRENYFRRPIALMVEYFFLLTLLDCTQLLKFVGL
jgi:hypothetical protein